MKSLSLSAPVLMARYAAYHRDRRNIATHFVGIPLIFLAIAMGLAFPLGTWGAYGITGAWLMWALTSFWYITRGDALLGLATVAVNALWVALAHALVAVAPGSGLAGWQLGLLLFVVGWVFQFVGHYWEGRKPAFVDDIVGLLVGPMFVVGEALMMLGLLAPLKARLEAEVGPVR